MRWQALSLREKIAQTIIYHQGTAEMSQQQDAYAPIFERYDVGGMFLGGEVIKHADSGAAEVLEMIRAWQQRVRIPMVFCADFENGCGTAMPGLTPFPFQMALGATQSEDLAYQYGKYTALEGRSVGLQWSLSPVADLNTNRLNPVTNYRALGEDPALVAPLVSAVVRGMQEHGMAATAKHFPGDGTDDRDQHLTTTQNRLPMDAWRQQHGAVFQRLIDQDVAAIMTGHIALPAYQQADQRDGRYLPATLSHELSTKLLKEAMGFRGVIVSDALVMGGFIKWFEDQTQAEVECFNAGTDMMLWPTPEYLEAVATAVERGEIPMARVDDAVARIWRLKERMGLFAPDFQVNRPMPEEERMAARQASQAVAEQSITLIRDRRNMLPLTTDAVRTVLLAAVCQDEKIYAGMAAMAHALEARGLTVRMERNLDFMTWRQLAPKYDLMVNVLFVGPHKPMGPLAFTAGEAWSAWGAGCAGFDKMVTICLGSPYLATDYAEYADCCLATYGFVDASQVAVIRAIFGEVAMTGQLPVTV